jgi:hypothetical protein
LVIPSLIDFFSGPDEGQVVRAKALADDLLEVVHGEHAKALAWVQHQQMELHQAQVQYAQYSAMAVCISSFFLCFSFTSGNAPHHRHVSPCVSVY